MFGRLPRCSAPCSRYLSSSSPLLTRRRLLPCGRLGSPSDRLSCGSPPLDSTLRRLASHQHWHRRIGMVSLAALALALAAVHVAPGRPRLLGCAGRRCAATRRPSLLRYPRGPLRLTGCRTCGCLGGSPRAEMPPLAPVLLAQIPPPICVVALANGSPSRTRRSGPSSSQRLLGCGCSLHLFGVPLWVYCALSLVVRSSLPCCSRAALSRTLDLLKSAFDTFVSTLRLAAAAAPRAASRTTSQLLLSGAKTIPGVHRHLVRLARRPPSPLDRFCPARRLLPRLARFCRARLP